MPLHCLIARHLFFGANLSPEHREACAQMGVLLHLAIGAAMFSHYTLSDGSPFDATAFVKSQINAAYQAVDGGAPATTVILNNDVFATESTFSLGRLFQTHSILHVLLLILLILAVIVIRSVKTFGDSIAAVLPLDALLHWWRPSGSGREESITQAKSLSLIRVRRLLTFALAL